MYLIRLDDASDHMNIENWAKVERLLDESGIKPLVGVIPLNRDPGLLNFPEDSGFWQKARDWQNKGWRIALHGYDHVFCSKDGGMNPVHKNSEYAGVPLKIQREKIRSGFAILKGNGLNPTAFFAPGHTFDENTLEALRLESDIRIISDTIANDIYSIHGFTFIPQQAGRVRKLPCRLSTVCLHPNYMKDQEFDELRDFFRAHASEFLDPNTISLTDRGPGLLDHVYKAAYFLKRKLSTLSR